MNPTLGDVMGVFKSLVFTVYLDWIQAHSLDRRAKFWQRNYFEHIIRNERELNAIRQYIIDNPDRWAWDTFNPAAVGPDPRAVELWHMLRGSQEKADKRRPSQPDGQAHHGAAPAAEEGPPSCPKCGQPMVLRTARRGGRHQGEQFWGCPNYPRCRGMRAADPQSNYSCNAL